MQATVPSSTAFDPESDLDVRVVTDVAPDDAAAPCNTDDGCAPTCASSWNSNGGA